VERFLTYKEDQRTPLDRDKLDTPCKVNSKGAQKRHDQLSSSRHISRKRRMTMSMALEVGAVAATEVLLVGSTMHHL